MLPIHSNLLNWKLEPDEEERAAILNPTQLAKLQTMNMELAIALAEFTFQAGGDSGALLNTVDYWQLRGRRSLVIELLTAHDEAIGQHQKPADDDHSTDSNQSRSF